MGAFVTKQTKIDRDRRMIAGVEKHFARSDRIRLDGEQYTREELIALLRERVELSHAVLAAKAAWQDAVQRERANAAKTARVAAALRKTIHLMFGSDAAALSDFGVAPHKERRPLSSEEKAMVVAKILATRAARHTMGKRQRRAIKGDVTPIVIVTQAAAPTSSRTPQLPEGPERPSRFGAV
jgi:hypothetical protein